MRRASYRIRAHHGMCLAFFQGNGYSDKFTEHMSHIKALLSDNPLVTIVNDTDDICLACPHNQAGICDSEEKVRQYDTQVLTHCGIAPGCCMRWQDFTDLVEQHILKTNRRSEICSDCIWDNLCH